MIAGSLLLLSMALGGSQSAPAAPKAPAKPAPQRAVAPNPATSCLPTVATMRELVTRTWAETHSPNEVLAKLNALIKYSDLEVLSTYQSRDGASINLEFPSRLYRFLVSEALRRREPLGAITVPSVVTVNVDTDQIDGLDISKVVVERDGKTVTPISSSLRRVVKTTALGAKGVFHKGLVSYPCSAFLPGTSVVVIGIPESGDNIEITLKSDDLARLTGHPSDE